MNKNFILYFSLIMGLLLPAFTRAQSYIKFSNYAGGSAFEDVADVKVVNGETYLIGHTRSLNFPVTNGTVNRGEQDIAITKYGVNGNVIYATYLGGRGNEIYTASKVVNGELYITGYTDSINFPVTDNSVFHGGRDVFVAKLAIDGSISFATYIGGNKNETPTFGFLEIVGNEVFISGTTASAGFPVTNSSVYAGGISDIFVTKLSATNGSIILSEMYGGNNQDFEYQALLDNGFIYIIGSTFSTDLPVTIGGILTDVFGSGFALKINTSNLNITYSRYLGGNNSDLILKQQVVNGILHIAGYTSSTDYPVTNTSAPSGEVHDYSDGFYTRLNPDGSILYSTYLSTDEPDFITDMVISSGNVYLTGTTNNAANGQRSIEVFKLDANGTFIYTKKFLVFGLTASPASFQVVNGELYFSGISMSGQYPVTNNSQFYGPSSGFFTHLDPAGNVVFSSFLGKMGALLPMKFENNKFYLLGNTTAASFPVTGMSNLPGGPDNILIVLNADGSTVFGGYIGGNSQDIAISMSVSNNEVYFGGKTSSIDFPVTNNVLYKGTNDQFITKISFCPANYLLTNDSLSPKTQTVCKLGLAQKITGVEINVPGDSLPPIYRNGIQQLQEPTKATYQWQTAFALAGPWTNIPNAVFKDYRPVVGSSDQFFRRLSYTLPECGTSLIHISDTATTFVNLLTAPTIDGGGPFITCPGSPVSIGGSPTVTGGNPPYPVYSWDPVADAVPNPIVSPDASSIYTLIVTDALGCQQIGQAAVFTYGADAGPDKGACGGIAATIGTAAITGIPGIQYNWQPVTDLSNSGIAQPLANPTTITDYTVTLTLTKSGGGTCDTKDTVRVTPVAAPLTPDFAGPDQVLCLDDSMSLGTVPESGFVYTWSPGSYLTSNTSSTSYYYPGNIVMPVPNPATLYLTAEKNGCSFPDQMIIATIEARAGLDGCGPRLVGMPDRTPGIEETYVWTKISGPGNFTGPTNLPQVPVSASVGGTTVYQLSVTYNGHTCTDYVNVESFCGNCQTLIEVDASYLCPDFDVNGGNVSLIAYTSLSNALYKWTPQVGLSNYTESVVHLTDNVPRIYTVTVTDADNPNVQCSDNIFVNDPAFSKPVFPAPDTATCIGVPVVIGVAPVAGYSYEWTGSGLSSNLSSNPTATVNVQTAFPVKVSDGNGCTLSDTVIVAIENVQADAGPDWVICSNGVVKLGTPAQPNTNYLWQPEASPWQNGTNQFSAQPEVFAAADLSFILSATTPAGCITKDTVNVVINDIPTLPDAFDKFVCLRNSVMIGNPALPGVIYQWTPAIGLNNPSIAQPLASPTVTTIYTVTATFPGTCSTVATDQVTVTVGNPSFNLPDISYCPKDGPVSLGNGAPANMVSYNWQPQQLVSNSTIANPTTLNPPPNSTTVFTLSVTNTDGCSYKDTITIIPYITPPIAGADKLICKGQSATVGSAANVTGPTITYNWSPANYLSDASSPNPLFTATTGGVFTYILTKTDNSVSCFSTDTIVITVVDLLPPLNATTACANSCVQVGTTPVTGITYLWSPVAGLSDPAIANPLACVGANTVIYTLLASDVNGCTSSANVVVSVSSVAAPQVTIPDVNACLGDNNVSFDPAITPPGVYSYLWSPDDGTLSDINSLTPQISITATGNTQYFLQVTDNNTGCTNTAVGNVVTTICPVLSTVGDFMWFDTNSDGIQDPGELGVSGMNVSLYNSADFNIGSVTTDANGLYHFIDVPPGNGYYVIFSKPAGYDFTIRNVGGAAANDNSKANDNGRSTNFNVPAGTDITNIDAGIKVSCTVPVTLLGFNAVLHNGQVWLNWQTTAEYNNHYFDVERSNNGNNFSAIGRVNGNGTTVLPHNYSLIDPHPWTGINYYRLNQVDIDGHSTYSSIVPIELKNDEIVSAYYNNLNNTIQVIFNKPQDNMHLKLYTANAQLIRSVRAANSISTYTLQLPVLSSGIYMLQIINDKFTYSKKLFIDK